MVYECRNQFGYRTAAIVERHEFSKKFSTRSFLFPTIALSGFLVGGGNAIAEAHINASGKRQAVVNTYSPCIASGTYSEIARINGFTATQPGFRTRAGQPIAGHRGYDSGVQAHLFGKVQSEDWPGGKSGNFPNATKFGGSIADYGKNVTFTIINKLTFIAACLYSSNIDSTLAVLPETEIFQKSAGQSVNRLLQGSLRVVFWL